jgi:hypothetical protein
MNKPDVALDRLQPEMPSAMLVLGGEQRIPNAIPIKQFPGSIKRVEMIYSRFTQSAAAHLCAWLIGQGVQVVPRATMPVDRVNDFVVQRAVAQSILADYKSGEILVNLTGGTKIMSLASAEAAREAFSTIYVDTESESLWWVHPEPRREALQVRFTVEDFLRLHGQDWAAPSPPSEQVQAVARTLATNFEALEPMVRYLKKQNEGRFFARRSLSRIEGRFLESCDAAGLLEESSNHGKPSSWRQWKMKRLRFFEKNEWLEALAFAACKDAGFEDVQWKIPVTGTETDIDVAATRGPLMLICSCKSGAFKNSHLDELDAQARLVGGLFCKKAIVLAEAIDFSRRHESGAVAQARKALESRAKALRIQPFYWEDYVDLGNKMRGYLSTGER